MIRTKKIHLCLIFFLLNFNADAKEPSKLISEIVNEASIILSSSDPVESKIIRLNNIAEKNVDIDGIGMYTLGKYRKTLNADQKIKYKKLFKSYFLKSFSSRLVDYSDPKINIVSQKKINDRYTIVSTVLEATSKNPELKIDWRIGAEYFESMLIDYDVHSNYGNWLYNAGIGNDSMPFRKFNPKLQSERYDPDKSYEKIWLNG